MATQARGDKEYVLPVNGLNSEANLLHFPQEFTPDVLNMEVGYNPQVVHPRKGIALEGSSTLADTRNVSDHDVAIHSYLWEAVSRDPNKNFIVVQVGRYLYFFDDTTYAAHPKRYDLNDVLSGTTEGTLALLEPERVDFAVIKGNLLICANAIDPVLIEFDGTDMNGTSLTLQMRDMLGIDDALQTDERPATLTDDHRYNLLNQGWYKQRRNASGSAVESDPITTFFSSFSLYPSNSDIAFLGMVEDSGDLIFDPEWLRDQTFGSTPAAKGHYIVNIFSRDRDAVIVDPFSSGTTYNGSADWNSNWVSIPTYNIP